MGFRSAVCAFTAELGFAVCIIHTYTYISINMYIYIRIELMSIHMPGLHIYVCVYDVLCRVCSCLYRYVCMYVCLISRVPTARISRLLSPNPGPTPLSVEPARCMAPIYSGSGYNFEPLHLPVVNLWKISDAWWAHCSRDLAKSAKQWALYFGASSGLILTALTKSTDHPSRAKLLVRRLKRWHPVMMVEPVECRARGALQALIHITRWSSLGSRPHRKVVQACSELEPFWVPTAFDHAFLGSLHPWRPP